MVSALCLPGVSLPCQARQGGRPIAPASQSHLLTTHLNSGKLRFRERNLTLGCLGSHFTVLETPAVRNTTTNTSQLSSRPRPSLGKRKPLGGDLQAPRLAGSLKVIKELSLHHPPPQPPPQDFCPLLDVGRVLKGVTNIISHSYCYPDFLILVICG